MEGQKGDTAWTLGMPHAHAHFILTSHVFHVFVLECTGDPVYFVRIFSSRLKIGSYSVADRYILNDCEINK